MKIMVKPRGLPSYPAWIGRTGLPQALAKTQGKRHAVLIFDRSLTKAPLALRRTRQTLRKQFKRVDEIAVSGGEGLKSFARIQALSARLAKLGARQDTVLIALGGGSVGDAVGFLASIYLRGVRWISMPTTLLGQVDSALGGKTAINLPEGKNLVGAFHHPIAVVCDLDFLRSLPAREIRSALGEVVKYGLAFDPALLAWTIANWGAFSGKDPALLRRVVVASLQWKALVVGQDPYEKTGMRRKLNLGHTFGHAIEKALASKIPHGQAVFFGLRAALILSGMRGHLRRTSQILMVLRFLESVPLPPAAARLKASTILRFIKQDKKSSRGRTLFILLKGIAQLIEDGHVSDAEIRRTWTTLVRKPARKRR